MSLAAGVYRNDGEAASWKNSSTVIGPQKEALSTRPCHCLHQSLHCVAIVLKFSNKYVGPGLRVIMHAMSKGQVYEEPVLFTFWIKFYARQPENKAI